MFKSNIKEKITSQLNFQLIENLNAAKLSIQNELTQFKLTKGISLKGHLNELNLNEVRIVKDAIEVEVALTGNLLIDIKGI